MFRNINKLHTFTNALYNTSTRYIPIAAENKRLEIRGTKSSIQSIDKAFVPLTFISPIKHLNKEVGIRLYLWTNARKLFDVFP